MKVLIGVFFFSAWASGLLGQYDLSKKYSLKEVQQDFSVMRKHLESVHGGLYTYTSEAEMDAYLDSLALQLNRDMTELELFKLIGPVLSKIKDAHTSISLSAACETYWEEQLPMLPLGFRWLKDGFFLSRNLSEDDTLKEGWRLLKINGESIDLVLTRLLKYVERDGDNLTSPRRLLASQFQDYYAYLEQRPAVHELLFEDKQGEQYQVELKAAKWSEQLEVWERRYGPLSGKPSPRLQFKILEDSIGYLKVSSWHPVRIKQGGQKYKRFFKQAFQEMEQKNIQHLILDMQNNGGGSEQVFMECLDYLLEEPYRVYKALYSRTVSIPDPDLYPYQNVKALSRYAQRKTTEKEGRYYVQKDPSLEPRQKNRKVFDGNLYVLLNEFSHSATGDMSGVLMQHQKGIFIGDESGGNPYENVAGESLVLQLPNTQIRISIPILHYKIDLDLPNNRHGVQPRYIIQPTIQEILAGENPVLTFTLDLIHDK